MENLAVTLLVPGEFEDIADDERSQTAHATAHEPPHSAPWRGVETIAPIRDRRFRSGSRDAGTAS
jgi:hypothetical protein